MVEHTQLRNIMYELYKKDYSNFSGIVWSYDQFFERYTALEYYIDKAQSEIRKIKIQKIKNQM